MNVSTIILIEETAAKFERIGGYIGPILSALAFILSSAAFTFSVMIALKERKRNIRQTLTNALSEVARINVEIAKLKNSEENFDQTIKILKNYNTQRGTLVADADFLISENEKLATAIDCELMASTYNDLGDDEKAEGYWHRAIEFTENQATNHAIQRGYASFLFGNNQIENARKQFESTIAIEMPLTDDNFVALIDTYVIWAKLEKNFSNQKEFNRLLTDAKAACNQIKNKEKCSKMQELLDNLKK